MIGSISSRLSKKGWLDYLYYKIGKQQFNFFLCGTYGDRQFTKWKRYLDCVAVIDNLESSKDSWEKSYFEEIDQRQILPNELVLDLEDPNQLKPIIENIKRWGWKYNLFKTGSRGYHIHLFYDSIITESQKKIIIEKLGTDIQKCYDKTLIALEYAPHWKTGKIKEEVFL